MKVIAVYLTDPQREQQAVATFPLPLDDATRERIREFIGRLYPGRSYELREEDVQAVPSQRLQ